MKLLALSLLFLVVSCNGVRTSLNSWLDSIFERANVEVRKSGSTSLYIEGGQLNDKVSYSDGTLLGLDSFYRTADSTDDFNSTHSIFDIHYGFKSLTAGFKNVNINGQNMSASFRIRDNSINFSFDLIRIYGCRIRLINLKVERLAKIDFASSSQEYDDSDVEEFFANEVISSINAYITSHKDEIEKSLQFLCHPHEANQYPEPRYLEFVEHFFYQTPK